MPRPHPIGLRAFLSLVLDPPTTVNASPVPCADPNEGLVTAAQSALQQLENFLFTTVIYRLVRFGRRPQGLRSKAASAGLVCAGLAIAGSITRDG